MYIDVCVFVNVSHEYNANTPNYLTVIPTPLNTIPKPSNQHPKQDKQITLNTKPKPYF